jgi:hypothetical protein
MLLMLNTFRAERHICSTQKGIRRFPRSFHHPTLLSILGKTKTLTVEIQAEKPKILQYSTIRQKVTEKQSDDKVTEPAREMFLNTCRLF